VAHTIGQETQDEVHPIQVMIISDQQPTAVRSLKASHMSKIAMVSGLIVASSRVQAKATSMTIKCRKCGNQHTLHVKPGFGGADLPPFCHGGQNKCGQNPYQILPDQSEFIDQQILKLQETPESVPTGELPRHIQLVVDRYLVGRAVPGTRVTMLGIYSIYKATGRMQQAGSGVALRYPYLRVLGVRIDNEGSGRVNQTFTEEEVQEFTEISRLPDLYNLIVKSIAPAIFGHEDVKRTIACQLFGGCRKVLPDGMKLRGDINVLLLGDPGTAKRYVHESYEHVTREHVTDALRRAVSCSNSWKKWPPSACTRAARARVRQV
jgi:DNA replication licensing factor MCM5